MSVDAIVRVLGIAGARPATIAVVAPQPTADALEQRVLAAIERHRRRHEEADGNALAPDVEERIAIRFEGASEHYRVYNDDKVVRIFRVVDEEQGLFVSRYVWSVEEVDAVIDHLERRAVAVAAANETDPFKRPPKKPRSKPAPPPEPEPAPDVEAEAAAALDAALGL